MRRAPRTHAHAGGARGAGGRSWLGCRGPAATDEGKSRKQFRVYLWSLRRAPDPVKADDTLALMVGSWGPWGLTPRDTEAGTTVVAEGLHGRNGFVKHWNFIPNCREIHTRTST